MTKNKHSAMPAGHGAELALNILYKMPCGCITKIMVVFVCKPSNARDKAF